MKLRLALVLLAATLAAPGQMKLNVQQLVSFLKSSVDLKHEDKKVADYLKNITLTERLDSRTVEDLVGYGIGPKTAQELDAMVETTKDLPVPPTQVKAPPKPIPPPSEAEQHEIIDKVRDYAMNYTQRLPDFICLQVTRRFADPSGMEFWHSLDVITTRLSFFEQKEDYKVVLVNNQPTDISYDKLGGATSAGEFGTMMKELFDKDTQATFQWDRWATLRGKRMHVYRYRVEQPHSKWTVHYEDLPSITTGYQGLVYVDRDSLAVSRIRLEAVGLPPSFPIQQASVELDYDLVDIGGTKYMLPLKHTMRMREGKLLVKNEVEFRMYRKFGADTSITFDTPDALPEDTEQPAKP